MSQRSSSDARSGAGTTPTPRANTSSSPRSSTSDGRSPSSSTSTSCCSRSRASSARLIAFEAFAVYLLDERRGELRIGLFGRLSREPRRRPVTAEARARASSARRWPSEQPLLVNDLTADPRYVEFVPGMHSELVVPLLHKSKPIGALNILSHNATQFTERDVAILAAVCRARRGRARQRAAVRASRRDAEAFETLAEIGREVDVDPRPRRALRAHRAARQARHRLPHVRHPAPERDQRARDASSPCSTARKSRCRASRSAKGSSATPRSTRNRCSSPTCRRTRATSSSCRRRAVRARDPAAAQGSLHRRRRSREPGARRVQQARRRDPDAAGEPGGGGDRERPAVRAGARQPDAAREGSALRAARAGGAAAGGAAEAPEGRRAGRALRIGARARRRLPRLPRRPNRTRSWSPWATSRARACRRRSTAPSPRSSCAAARSAAATCPIDRAPPACCRR